MMKPLAAAILALPLLGACGAPVFRIDAPPAVARGDAARVPVSVGSVEVQDVSLPLYANQEVIYFETPEGALASNDNLLWADDPTRSFTEGLAMTLAQITRARAAAEPWPFYERPDARLDVRFARALAQNDGTFRITGQYFVAATDIDGREAARSFDLSAPYDALTTGSIAAARARVIEALARQIAADGL
ncbi:hypothetical protein E2L08_06390 [Palleronia sediminis]|uniref:ABC-type transport auxiliary lipoprotein component domain-containing protein n=1 Tax=Palleronia sediminis TaxID=2547833 RepID=A0A4R6AEB5_9RHOB|nr:ABC-type transport auxiliary lipoprotein family protein [Palleronia sediminis]TDL81294.1 hypothetical protein E2L08_06390 [Palleronia sediminis]